MYGPIRMAIFGYISEIKKVILDKSASAYNKAKNFVKRKNNQEQSNEEPNANKSAIDR
jgi:hypothetical protein